MPERLHHSVTARRSAATKNSNEATDNSEYSTSVKVFTHKNKFPDRLRKEPDIKKTELIRTSCASSVFSVFRAQRHIQSVV